MIAIGIRYLTKYAVATNQARQEPEWPPHPGRVMMAMAAAFFEGGSDGMERTALEWLEGVPAPELRASGADNRSSVRAFVYVNDTHGGITGRLRQDRALPRARPHDDCVYLIWHSSPTLEIRAVLNRICERVTRVGHSMSAVQMWVVAEGEEPEANWLPGETRHEIRLRVSSSGTLRYLEESFNGKAVEEYFRLLESLEDAQGPLKVRLQKELKGTFPNGRPESRPPKIVRWQGYYRRSLEEVKKPVAEGPFDENFVVLGKLDGPMLGLESTLQLTGALRNAAMTASPVQPPPEWLSGHDVEGKPSLHPHVAFFPLPYVGYEHSDGHVMGLGIAVPRDLRLSGNATREEELRRILGPLLFDGSGEERNIRLWRERERGETLWAWTLEREKRERPPVSLQRVNWTKPSRKWASVTPVVLHHYPKKREGHIEGIVQEAFQSARFPRPAAVKCLSVPAVPGADHALSVPPYQQGGDNLCRYQTHVVVEFEQPVRGPMLVGRGRYRGYGLFRPETDGSSAHE